MTRTYAALWLLVATAVATGIVVGLLVAHAILPDAVAASRSAPESTPAASPRPQYDGAPVPLSSSETLARSGQPDGHPGARDTGRTSGITPSPATGKRPAPAEEPDTASTLSGIATWFDSPAGVSAAGPDLRAALGPGWRGTTVAVSANGRTVTTVLGDWMRADRLIDLHAPLFAQLAPLSVGVLSVTVTLIPAPPVTSSEDTP